MKNNKKELSNIISFCFSISFTLKNYYENNSVLKKDVDKLVKRVLQLEKVLNRNSKKESLIKLVRSDILKIKESLIRMLQHQVIIKNLSIKF